ncbi:MAG: hypothetical protein MZV49_08590 [Rhodopseudomonas palustris]|nr:hypothetical protein [Rhodopseudomonas palustris]
MTGSSRATGVSAPVRPTWMSMSSRTVVGLLGRELVRDRPARRRDSEAEPRAAVEPVDLVDHAVDVVAAAARAARSICAIEGQQRLGPVGRASISGIDRKPQPCSRSRHP